ncbi:MAG: ATP synthase subunit I [Clostridium sp.]
MDDEVRFMLKRVTIYNLIISLVIANIIGTFNSKYAFVFLAGCSVAVFNFIINSISINLSLSKPQGNRAFLIIGITFRIIFAVTIGFKVIISNPYNIIPYVLGYASHVLGMVAYGLTNK